MTSSSYIPRRLHTSPTIIPIAPPAVWVCLPSVRVDLLYSIKVSPTIIPIVLLAM